MSSNKARRAGERRRKWRQEARANGETDEVAIERAVWRRQLRNDGLTEVSIEAHLDDYVYASIAKRLEDSAAAHRMVFGDGYTSPDDTRFRPTSTPKELVGPGRATGASAAAIRRGKTITKWQHEQSDRPHR
jgi:hypothetical protein